MLMEMEAEKAILFNFCFLKKKVATRRKVAASTLNSSKHAFQCSSSSSNKKAGNEKKEREIVSKLPEQLFGPEVPNKDVPPDPRHQEHPGEVDHRRV